MAVPRILTGWPAWRARNVESSVASTKPDPRMWGEARKVRVVSPWSLE
jgi:hypothetical protein